MTRFLNRAPVLRRTLCAGALVSAAVACAHATAAQERTAAPQRPNIVVILADDMGYSDIAPYGSEIRTPNLDRLAAGGLRFRQFYNNAKCSPTRASLLTGLYPHQAGMGALANGKPGEPGPYQGYLSDNSVTMAEALRDAGYRTYMSGKWHLGDLPEHWPHSRGFHRYFGLISGATSFFELLPEPGRVRQMVLEDRLWQPEGDGFYATDAYNDYAAERIREHHREHPEQPFFLYLAHTVPHFPLHALPEDIARYQGRYDVGWDSLRVERYARMRELGVIDQRYEPGPRPSTIPAWQSVRNKADWTRRMEVYAAMIDRMDQGIGRVLAALEETGQAENTLVLFLSDNGGTAENVEGRGLNDPSVPMGARGSYVAYREPWAYVSNTPFRLYKNWVHEGGIITPLIAHWPAGIRESGRITGEVGHVIDLMPTVLELAGAKYPSVRDGRSMIPLQGRSLAPVLQGKHLERSEPLFWAYGGKWAVRDGDWKLVHDGGTSSRPELFNLAHDPTERRDLAALHPERAAAMKARWQAWAMHVGAREALTR